MGLVRAVRSFTKNTLAYGPARAARKLKNIDKAFPAGTPGWVGKRMRARRRLVRNVKRQIHWRQLFRTEDWADAKSLARQAVRMRERT